MTHRYKIPLSAHLLKSRFHGITQQWEALFGYSRVTLPNCRGRGLRAKKKKRKKKKSRLWAHVLHPFVKHPILIPMGSINSPFSVRLTGSRSPKDKRWSTTIENHISTRTLTQNLRSKAALESHIRPEVRDTETPVTKLRNRDKAVPTAGLCIRSKKKKGKRTQSFHVLLCVY